MGVFPTAPTPPSPYNWLDDGTITLHCVLFSTLLPVIRRRWSPLFAAPLPRLLYITIYYNYYTHIHPGAPHDYQLTNTTEEKRCTDSFPWFDWRPGHSIKRGQATHLPSSKKKSLSKALLAFKFRQIDTFSKDLNPPTIRQVSLRKDDKKGGFRGIRNTMIDILLPPVESNLPPLFCYVTSNLCDNKMISWMPPTSYWIPDFFGSRIFGSEDDGTQPAADLTSFFSTTTKKNLYTHHV